MFDRERSIIQDIFYFLIGLQNNPAPHQRQMYVGPGQRIHLTKANMSITRMIL